MGINFKDYLIKTEWTERNDVIDFVLDNIKIKTIKELKLDETIILSKDDIEYTLRAKGSSRFLLIFWKTKKDKKCVLWIPYIELLSFNKENINIYCIPMCWNDILWNGVSIIDVELFEEEKQHKLFITDVYYYCGKDLQKVFRKEKKKMFSIRKHYKVSKKQFYAKLNWINIKANMTDKTQFTKQYDFDGLWCLSKVSGIRWYLDNKVNIKRKNDLLKK